MRRVSFALSGMWVVAVHASSEHSFSKKSASQIRLISGYGVSGDAHFGETVMHRSRVAKDPNQPNLRQVHLLHAELFDELHQCGFDVEPGELGENVTTAGVDLLNLSVGTRLVLGDNALVEVTGLRNPCAQIEAHQAGLLSAVVGRSADGSLARKAGIMGIVVRGGVVKPGDPIYISHVPERHSPLHPV